MSLMTQVFPILSLERDSPCDHKMADVAPPKQEERAWETKDLLSCLSYPRGELSKKTIPLYLTDQNKVTCLLLDYSLAKRKAFP